MNIPFSQISGLASPREEQLFLTEKLRPGLSEKS
jgi:hypothetical protein